MTQAREFRVVGARVPPVDWDQRTAGAADYSADVRPDGLLYARVLRSVHAHARLLSVDCTAALRLPGVHAAVTADDLPPGVKYLHMGGDLADRRPLAKDVVRYVGEEVAAVAAETPEQADAAVAAIAVRYHPLTAPLTVDEALDPRARQLHGRSSGRKNVSAHYTGEWGDAARGRAASTVTVDGTFWYPRVAHACMETHTTLAWWHEDRHLMELWTSTQAPWFVSTEVAHVLGLDPAQVVCRDVAVGGGFGAKSKICEQEVLAAALSRATRRPVQLAYSREEEFAATKPRHAFRVSLRSSADKDGRIRALEAELDVDNGAYNHHGPSVTKVAIKTLGTIYQPDGVTWDARLIDTALPPGGQFRGYGSPQVVFAMESQVDELAEKLGYDPLDLRLLNANRPQSISLAGARIGSARLVECLEAVRDAIGWDEKRRRRHPFRGVGVACGMHGSGAFAEAGANRSDAAVDLFADGRVRVRFGGADAGTGQRTILAQIAAEELGVDIGSVEVMMTDGEQTPFDMGAWSSRGTHMGGHAVRQTAAELADQLRALAAEKLGGGSVSLAAGQASSPMGSVPLGDLVHLSASSVDGTLSHETSYVDPRMEHFLGGNPRPNASASYTFAAHAVEVEVDPATGRIHILDYVAAHDVGRAINPTMVEGQIIGGVAQGIGAALGEELLYEGGRVVNPAYMNYALPRAADVPPIRVVLLEGDEEAGPYDAKSVGEMPIIPPAAAIANAVYDAIGVRLRELPLTPDKVLGALAERRRGYRISRRPGRWWIEAVRRAYPLGLHALLHRYGTRLARKTPVDQVAAVHHPETLDRLLELRTAGSAIMGGGTDLHVQRRQGLVAPVTLLSLSRVRELAHVEVGADGSIEIGAGVSLEQLSKRVASLLPALAEAADAVASAQIRSVATVGGNLVQAKRFWFFRNGFDCYKRGGPTCPCYAVQGDHRFQHAIIDGHRCQAVTPSDLATVLTSLQAEVVVTSGVGSRVVPMDRFYVGPGETVLKETDVVTSVRISASATAGIAAFDKLELTQGDFAIVSAAVWAQIDPTGVWTDARIVLGAVAPTPWRAYGVEKAMTGVAFDEARFREALDDDLTRHGHPLRDNEWKVDAALGLTVRLATRVNGMAAGSAARGSAGP